jgi:hypothetical protein
MSRKIYTFGFISILMVIQLNLSRVYSQTAYAADMGNLKIVTFDLSNPGSVTILASLPDDYSIYISAGSWANDTWYVGEFNNMELGTVNVTTGAYTSVGYSGIFFFGMAYDITTSTMYAIGSEDFSDFALYIVNLNDGSTSAVGSVGSGWYDSYPAGLACSPAGVLYTTDAYGWLYSINKTNASVSVIGNMFIGLYDIPNLEYDLTNDQLYLSVSNSTSTIGSLYMVDPTDGSVALVGNYPGGSPYFYGLAIPEVVTPTTAWTGVVNNSWSFPFNWDNGVPTGTANATIPVVAGYYPVISSAVACNDLTINTSASLEISTNGSLTVNNVLTNNGTLTIKSSASGTGSLIENNGVSASIERYFSGNDVDWHLVSSPVSNVTANVFLAMYLQNFNETTNSYTDVTLPETPLNVLEGYAVYSTLSSANTVTFNGNLNTGTQTKGFSANNAGWNLMGNPFASSIDWEAVTIPSGLSNEVHYIEASTGNDLSYVKGVGGTGSQYIPPMQGFFVKATAAGTFSVGNAQRTHLGAGNFYKSYNPQLLVLEASGANYSDQVWIHFNDQAGAEHDGVYDAYKKISISNPELPQIFSYTPSGEILAVNGLPETTTVPVGFTVVESGSYTITAIEKGEFTTIYLEDLLTGTITNLMINSYSYDHNAGDPVHRFNLHFKSLSTDEIIAANHNIFANDGKVYIESKGNYDLAQVYDVTGQLIANTILNNGMNEIAVKKTGNYIVRVISSTSVSTKKVFIK